MVKTQNSKSVNDMTVGSPLRAIIQFAIPLILGYILQQMYLIIEGEEGGGLGLAIHSTAPGTGYMQVNADGTIKQIYPP